MKIKQIRKIRDLPAYKKITKTAARLRREAQRNIDAYQIDDSVAREVARLFTRLPGITEVFPRMQEEQENADLRKERNASECSEPT